MDYDVEIRDGIGLVVVRSAFGLECFLAALTELLSMPGFTPGMPCLWDVRQSITTLDREAIREMGRVVHQHAERRGQGKTAVVVGADLAFGMARMYELMTDSEDRNPFRVFRDVTVARAWLGSESQ